MPPRTTRATKVLKENVDIVTKSKVISGGRVTKSSRKALADKTNSLSDDNESIDIPVKTSKKTLNSKSTKLNENDKVRPRRERRLPPRYVENQTLKNLSNSKDSPVKQSSVSSKTDITLKKPHVNKPLIKNSQDIIISSKHGPNVSPLQEQPKHKEVLSKYRKTSKNVDKQVPITKFLTEDETCPKKTCRVQCDVENSKDSLNLTSPFKTPSKDTENSLIVNRPKRVCRLPSRFEDHSISPNKFIPVQPCHASTPIIKKNNKIANKNALNVSDKKKEDSENKKGENTNQPIAKETSSKLTNKAITSNTSNSPSNKNTPDTNNNGKKKVLRPKRVTVKTKLQTKQVSPKNKIKPFAGRLLDNSLSFRVLEDRQSRAKGLDVYEFTFDPNEEPPPKKKRKKPVKKRPAKPKTVVFKSNYDDNVSKALENLKSKIKPSQTKPVLCNSKVVENVEKPAENHAMPTGNRVITENVEITKNAQPSAAENMQTAPPIAKSALSGNISRSNYSTDNATPAMPAINESINSIHASNYASMRVEDIAADFEFSDHHNDINYSPVNSPHQQLIPDHETMPEVPEPNKIMDPVNIKDPLNLQDDTSFFEDPPVASSSMNVSVRHPLASPWRVEFGSLPMKWHSNTYVKANMTPAVECSFINSEVTKKKHIYTNIVSEEPLPEIFENAASALKQTSIISFMKEVAERKANKKKRRRSQTPTRATVEGITAPANKASKSPKKAKVSKESTPNTSENTNNASKDKENSTNSSNKSLSPTKKKKDKDCTYFGFDESETVDQENVSPVKVNLNPKTRELRSRNVLQVLNTQPIPTRAAMPISAKTKLTSAEVVDQLYDQLKSAEDAQFPVTEAAKELVNNTVACNEDDPSWCEDNEDSNSVHLFEDIEVVHHLKPHRKSYGKAKKVTFQRSASADSDSQPLVRREPDSSDDDLTDLSFHLPDIKQINKNKRTKKTKRKQQFTKKEEKEVEEWAAGFNSMCEDIDDFALLVE